MSDLNHALMQLGLPFIIKTRRQGYDGKGQVIIRSAEDFQLIENSMLQQGTIAEAWVNYVREFSIIAVRATNGEVLFYDLCENTHQSGILSQTINKIHDAALTKVTPYVEKLLNDFDYCGVLTVEFFEKAGDEYLVNEIAPRVHNSGHWTIEGAITSQFQNHLRAITGQPLGDTASNYNVVMKNIIGKLPSSHDILQNPKSHMHIYGKQEKPGRKLGHITQIIK